MTPSTAGLLAGWLLFRHCRWLPLPLPPPPPSPPPASGYTFTRPSFRWRRYCYLWPRLSRWHPFPLSLPRCRLSATAKPIPRYIASIPIRISRVKESFEEATNFVSLIPSFKFSPERERERERAPSTLPETSFGDKCS